MTVIFLHVQKDNVSNQREHLILLLANVHIRKNPKLDQHTKVPIIFQVLFGIESSLSIILRHTSIGFMDSWMTVHWMRL